MAYSELVKDLDGDSYQYTPNWLCLVIPFEYTSSFDREKIVNFNKDTPTFSTDKVSENPTLERGDGILIEDDCVSWNISGTKQSNNESLTLSLAYSGNNYLNIINSKDWIIFWSFDNATDYNRIKKKILDKDYSNLNDKNSGFKFLGRVNSIVDNIIFNSNGTKSIKFSITAHSFEELNSVIFFDPSIQLENTNSEGTWGDLKELENLPSSILSNVSQIISTQDVIMRILIQTLQKGPGKESHPNLGTENERINMVPSPNKPYIVPSIIFKIFGDDTDFPVDKTYVDILKVYIGVQKYSDNDFLPYINQVNGPFFQTPEPLTDPHVLQPFYYNGQTIWSIMESYINRPINEMYSCLRLNSSNKIIPTLIVRRTPFSLRETFINAPQTSSSSDFQKDLDFYNSPHFKILDDKEKENLMKKRSERHDPKPFELNVTFFKDLPRWLLNKDLIQTMQIGKNSINRYNYIQAMPFRPGGDMQYLRSNLRPIDDKADIRRSGLHMFNKQLSSVLPEAGSENTAMSDVYLAEKFNVFLADILMDGHLRLSGTIQCKGIQKPICQGDNIVIDNMLFHIEGISHSGNMAPNGTKTFNTNIAVSNGMVLTNEELGFYEEESLKDSVGINWEYK